MVDPLRSSCSRDYFPDYNLEAFIFHACFVGYLGDRPGGLQNDGQDGVLMVAVVDATAFGLEIGVFSEAR